jgi:hypothetical protein
MPTYRVAGEVDAFCTRCKLNLAHTIVAMVASKIARVRCNTCGGEHAFRTEDSSRRSAVASAQRPTGQRTVLSFADRLAASNPAEATPYNPKLAYTLDQLISHPTFGLGIVTALREDKMDVAFKAIEKTLIQRRGEPVDRPSFHPPQPNTGYPGDKPPSHRSSSDDSEQK